MKSVLISIQPKWCELIASGKKTIEVRKTAPKLETPFKCYIYCTKDAKKHYYIDEYGDRQVELIPQKVIGEFVCDRITTLNYDTDWGVEPPQEGFFLVEPYAENVLLDFNPCLTNKELILYGKGKLLYGWHISDLKIYDTPKELWEFKYPCPVKFANYDCSWGFEECKYKVPDRVPYECDAGLTRPPQSWCYVEEL